MTPEDWEDLPDGQGLEAKSWQEIIAMIEADYAARERGEIEDRWYGPDVYCLLNAPEWVKRQIYGASTHNPQPGTHNEHTRL